MKKEAVFWAWYYSKPSKKNYHQRKKNKVNNLQDKRAAFKSAALFLNPLKLGFYLLAFCEWNKKKECIWLGTVFKMCGKQISTMVHNKLEWHTHPSFPLLQRYAIVYVRFLKISR